MPAPATPPDLVTVPASSTPPDLVELVRSAFASVLAGTAIGADTDFYQAGGQSLAAVRLCVAVEDALGVPVRSRDLAANPTPASLAALLVDRSAGPAPARPTVPTHPVDHAPGEAAPDSVRWLWLEMQRRTGHSSAYTVTAQLDISGPLDGDRLARAVELLQWERPTLRTVVVEYLGGPRLLVTNTVSQLHIVDLRGQPDQDARAERVVRRLAHEPFDLAGGPLFRAALIRRDDTDPTLVLAASHVVSDGTSLEIMVDELARLHDRPLFDAAPPEPPTPRPVTDRARADAIAHWRSLLTPAPAPPRLPVAGPRTDAPNRVAGQAVRDLPPTLVARLRDLAVDSRAGLFAPLAAGVALGLAEATGSADVCLGTAVDRRSRLGLDGELGFHVGTVPLRLRTERPRLADVARQVAAQTADAVDHSVLPFDEMVAILDPPREPGRHPWFDVTVEWNPLLRAGGPDGTEFTGGPVELEYCQFELTFLFTQTRAGVRLTVRYDRDLYQPGTAEWLADRVLSALAGTDPSATTAATTPVFAGFDFAADNRGADSVDVHQG